MTVPIRSTRPNCSKFWTTTPFQLVFSGWVLANRSPAIAKTVYERGHWIGLHGYDHRSFPHHLLTSSKACSNPSRDRPSLLCASNEHRTSDLPMVCLHPNLGFVIPVAVSACDVSVVPRLGSTWSLLQRVLQQVQNGSLIVLHDGACGGQDVAAPTPAGSPTATTRLSICATLWRHGSV